MYLLRFCWKPMLHPIIGNYQSGSNTGSTSEHEDSNAFTEESTTSHSSVRGTGEPHLTAQSVGQSSVPSVHYVRMLEQELAILRRKNREYETTIAHQANFICQESLARNHNQNMRHALTSSSNTSSSSSQLHPGFSSTLGAQCDNLAISSSHTSGFGIQRPITPIRTTPLPPKLNLGVSSMPISSKLNSVFDHSSFDDASTTSHSIKPDWSVEYNLEVGRTPEVNLMRTIMDKRGAYNLKFSPDGHLLAVIASKGQVVTIYNVATGRRICQLEDLYVKKEPPGTIALRFSPNNKYLATCTGRTENIIRIWEVGKKRVRNVLKGHTDGIFSLGFSPDGRHLISGAYDKAVRIWNMRDGSSRIFDNSSSGISFVHFSPDGRHFVAGTFSAEVLLWDMRSGHLVASLKGHAGVVTGIVFVTNGEGLISCSTDRTLKYWDIGGLTSARMFGEKGHAADCVGIKETLTFAGHTNTIRSVSISSDHGQWLASGSDDHTIRIWNTKTGKQQCILQGHTKEVRSVDFSPAGGYLASAGEDGLVHIWSFRASDDQ